LTRTLTFLHTSPVHVATFNQLLAELDPTITLKHVVNVGLLEEAQAAGEVTPALAHRVTELIVAELAGNDNILLCTCSTIGPVAEQVNQLMPQRVLRVDRPMAEQAVARGSHIIIMAALATTFEPTRQLILEVAAQADKQVEITEVHCATAWPKFLAGDKAGYLADIAASITKVASEGDIIVLAQASMAEAALLCKDIATPILSSPYLGAAAAVALLKA
jgi:hypothetical protein